MHTATASMQKAASIRKGVTGAADCFRAAIGHRSHLAANITLSVEGEYNEQSRLNYCEMVISDVLVIFSVALETNEERKLKG